MIKTFKNKASKKIYEGHKVGGFRGLDRSMALERLDILDAATKLADIPPLRSIHLHPLKGDRKGQWAISVNGPWRICFEYRDGDAYDVEITDYHEG
jgi:proteic killer suppression protein